MRDVEALDGTLIWVLGILTAHKGEWELAESSKRLKLKVDSDVADTFLDPLWLHEGQRCAVRGALFGRPNEVPFLVVERLVTARSFGIRQDARPQRR